MTDDSFLTQSLETLSITSTTYSIQVEGDVSTSNETHKEISIEDFLSTRKLEEMMNAAYEKYTMNMFDENVFDDSRVFDDWSTSTDYEHLETIGIPTSPTSDTTIEYPGEPPTAAESITSQSWKCFIGSCQRTYISGAGLRYHMKHCHRIRVPIRAGPRPKVPKRTQWRCENCAKVYTTMAGYRYHLKNGLMGCRKE